MRTLYESRLDNTVDAGSIGIGETVDVRTKMGEPVATGDVIASNPFGVVLEKHGFFNRDLYLFAPLEVRADIRPTNALNSSPDDRVAEKLRAYGEDAGVFEAEKLDDKDVKKDEKPDGDEEDDIGSEDKPKKDKKDDEENQPLAKPDSSVDVDKLPEDIKKAVISTTQMSEDDLNGVMAEIGDSTVKSLKRANVKDTEIYSVASKVQNAVFRILTGKSPAPPAPPKKKANK